MDEIVGFLWSPCIKLWDTIIERMVDDDILVEYSMFDFEEKISEYESAILEIYRTDDISLEKVKNVKINAMKSYPNSFVKFKIKIDPRYRTKRISNKPISRTVEQIKKTIRSEYKSEIVNYVHDIIVHIADNVEQTIEIEKNMIKYSEFKKNTFFTLKRLLGFQMLRGQFNRVDTLIRKYSIERFLESPDYDFDLYTRMQIARTNQCNVFKFKRLISSFLKKGFDPRFPIPINSRNYCMINGSHRTAIAYYLGIKLVPVHIIPRRGGKPYYRTWFIGKNFTDGDFDIIDDELNNLHNFLQND